MALWLAKHFFLSFQRMFKFLNLCLKDRFRFECCAKQHENHKTIKSQHKLSK